MAYTPTVYTNDASSPDLDATNLNKSENGIKDAHLIAVPVDCSSRVAEYTGDGIPLIPDNVAGTTYRSNFATTDGFSAIRGTISVSGGNLVFNKTSTAAYNMYADKSLSFSAKVVCFKVTALQNINNFILYGISGSDVNIASTSYMFSGDTKIISGYDAGTYTTLRLLVNTVSLEQTGELAKVDVVYIGTGAYDTPALDRAGNSNSLALTAVTPVNGKYGKEMSFNGSTSYARASSPVIGTTGTVAIRFKRGAVGAFSYLLATLNSSGYKGVGLSFNTSNVLRLVFGASASTQIIELAPAIAETTAYHTLVFTFSASAYYSLLDTTEKSGALTNPIDVSVTNLILGGMVTTPSFNGIISHFRYDSRVWTADEARAWSLNPISIDSRV